MFVGFYSIIPLSFQDYPDVILYGIITPTTLGRARFTPEFYIAAEQKNAAVYGAEILGPVQFGAPVEFSLGVEQSHLHNEIAVRINA